MKNEERERLKADLAEIENDIQRMLMGQEEVTALEAQPDDLPPARVAEHDYDNEMVEIQERSKAIIDNLAKLYLGDDERLINHDYLAKKRQKDSDYLSKLDFLVNASQRTLTSIMKEIDMGASTPRMYEVMSMLQKEMRENIKMSSTNLTTIEGFYKSMREDLGLGSGTATGQASMEEKKENSTIVNFKSLNAQIDEIIRSKTTPPPTDV